jgi:hypothetical protein
MAKKKKIVQVIDIVPAKKKTAPAEPRMEARNSGSDELLKELEAFRSQNTAFENPAPVREEPVREERRERKKRGSRRVYLGVFIVVVLLGTGYAVASALPKMDMHITMKKSLVSYKESVFIKTSIGELNASAKEIPGEVITKKANTAVEFVPTGTQAAQQKATGKIIVFNAYSSAPQILVATTRFETPDGKIYRLVNRITVPGAKTSGGVIEPSSIEADIVADKAGAEYAVNSVERLTIPGFKGTPRYEKFYGQIVDPVSIVSCSATDADIAEAQKSAEEKLKNDIAALIQLQIPSGVRYMEGSQQFSVTAKKVETASRGGVCTLTLEGEGKAFVFRESDVHQFIRSLALDAEAIQENDVEKDFTVSYGVPVMQSSGVISLPLDVQAAYWKKPDAEALKDELAGKKELEVKSVALAKEGVDKLSVSFWPFWVSSAPKNTDRISITLE